MPLLDIVFCVAVLFSVIAGLFKGFVREILSLFFFGLAVYLSFSFYEVAGEYLTRYISKANVAAFVAFFIIFVFVIISGSIVTWLVQKFTVIGPLKSANRLLGALFGLIRGVLVAGIILYLMVVFKIGTEEIGKSKTVPYVTYVMNQVFEMLPEGYQIKSSTKDVSVKTGV